MPKVYEQQLSWQPANGARMQYDRIQDFITPALENATKTSQNAMDALRQVGDKQAASELEQAAMDAAFDIDNWTDFSKPEETQDKMVANAMEKYDKVFANLDPSTQRRMNLYNPKAREIYEVKAKEKAADASYNYAFKDAMANMDKDVGRMITESNPEDPSSVKNAMNAHLARMKKTMRPADYLAYEKALKPTAEKGLVDWYIAQGRLGDAYNSVINDGATGDVNESTRASYLKAIKTAMKSKGDSDEIGTNLMDTLIHRGIPQSQAYAAMSELVSAVENDGEPDAKILEQYGDLPLVGGFSYYQLHNMDRSKAIGIIDKTYKAVGKSTAIQGDARAAFVPLMTEWARITETENGITTLKKDMDMDQLGIMYDKFEKAGYVRALDTTSNSDMSKTLTEIGDAVRERKQRAAMAFDNLGYNASAVYNSPVTRDVFPMPATKEQAAMWDTKEQQQQMLNTRKVRYSAEALNNIHDEYARKQAERAAKKENEKEPTQYEKMRSELKEMKNNNEISEQRYKETSRYLYDLSEGRASVTYPCLVSGVSAREWNQCLSSYGFGLTNDSVAYDKKMDRGMHEWSANLRDAEKEYGVVYDSGTVGDVYQVLLSRISLSLPIPGQAEKYGIENPGIFTGMFMADVMSDLRSLRGGELNDLVDLTNNASLYKEKGGDYEGISWDPANPSPQTSTDITRSKQYQLIGDIEQVLSERLGKNIQFDEEEKKKMALEIRKISSGKRRSVKSDTSEKDRKELTNKRTQELQQVLGIGAM